MFRALLLAIAGTASDPLPVEVPARLAAVTSQPELSGIAWSSALDRYLVVSDDTGHKDAVHQPRAVRLDDDGG